MRRFFLSTLLTLTSVAAALPETVTVRKDETLYRIATRHRLSVDELKRLNGLKSNIIEIGQVLRLTPTGTPAKPARSKAGQTKPAQFKEAPPQPAQAKSVPSRPVQLKAPQAKAAVSRVGTPPVPKSAPPRPPTTYTVRGGDTLATISPRVGLSLAQLRRLNGLKGDALEAGQVLPAAPALIRKSSR